MSGVIVAFQPHSKQPPIPIRSRPARLRALPQFSAIVMWMASAILQHTGNDVTHVTEDNIQPTLRDQIAEEAVRGLAALDPIAESVARRRARQLAGDLIANMALRSSNGLIDLTDAAVVDEYGSRIADAVLERYRMQLVYANTPAVEEAKN